MIHKSINDKKSLKIEILLPVKQAISVEPWAQNPKNLNQKIQLMNY